MGNAVVCKLRAAAGPPTLTARRGRLSARSVLWKLKLNEYAATIGGALAERLYQRAHRTAARWPATHRCGGGVCDPEHQYTHLDHARAPRRGSQDRYHRESRAGAARSR